MTEGIKKIGNFAPEAAGFSELQRIKLEARKCYLQKAFYEDNFGNIEDWAELSLIVSEEQFRLVQQSMLQFPYLMPHIMINEKEVLVLLEFNEYYNKLQRGIGYNFLVRLGERIELISISSPRPKYSAQFPDLTALQEYRRKGRLIIKLQSHLENQNMAIFIELPYANGLFANYFH